MRTGQGILTSTTKHGIMNLSREELLSQLRQMDEYEFEELVADIWEQRGWETTVTTASNDRGIDVIAKRKNPFAQKYVIQAKRYKQGNTVGSPDIQQYSSLQQQESNVDSVIVVTTSSFTAEAKKIGNKLNVKLIDGFDLSDMILQGNTKSILSGYQKISYETTSENRKNAESANKPQPGNSRTDDFPKQSERQDIISSTSIWTKFLPSFLITIFNSPDSIFEQCPNCKKSSLIREKLFFPTTFVCEDCGAKLRNDWKKLSILSYYKLTNSDSDLDGESKKVTKWMKLASNSSGGLRLEDSIQSRNSATIITGDEDSYYEKIESNGIKRKHAETRGDGALRLINNGSCPLCGIDAKSISSVFSDDPGNCPLYEYEHIESEYVIRYRRKLRTKNINSERIVGCESCKSIWVPKEDNDTFGQKYIQCSI